ncbi:RNA pyrophosphohydrolase [Helicobacter sp. MIT 14-3879]|uniref:RNA pyrophosphohydrolase n=1 Tax=Helicobacter sp. MIT 14-3879 TaxID=2040649 RepID=UPI000E1F440F|nr:RNA pyrophosphohydrolase [Helicobacter sp. MIT 14-3879]RDU64845.1 RNA pyrophosphohydrolase [Helicobacter sp. MIT 14-3879]
MSKYRPNVAAIILSEKYPDICEFFIAQRNDIKNVKNVWQFPQGGIDYGESPLEALYRELEEEIGTSNVEVLAEYPEWLKYNFPTGNIRTKMYPFKGQRQKYFLVKLRDNTLINLDTNVPEFVRYKFVNYENIFVNIVYFKRPIYKKVLEYFKKEGYIS